MSYPNSKSSKGVLITGATGFIGVYLTRAFLKEGWRVFTALHTRPLPDSFLKAGATPILLNINNTDNTKSVMSKLDAICHLAAYVPPNYDDSRYAEECLNVNALLTLRLAEQAECFPKLRFIYFSAAQSYNMSNKQLDENSQLYPADKATYYLTSKLAGEIFVEHLHRSKGLQAVILRIGACYGYGMRPQSVVSVFMEKARKGEPLEVRDNGEVLFDFTYINDVTTTAVQAVKTGDPGIYNVGSGTLHSVLGLADTAADIYRNEKEVPIHVLAEQKNILSANKHISIGKAMQTWEFRPTSLKEGLQAYRKQAEAILYDRSDI